MLKAALLCSLVCSAFVVGGRLSPAAPDAPAHVAKAHSLRDVLLALKGKKCLMTRQGDLWILNFHSKTKGKHQVMDVVGTDYVSLTDENSTALTPLSSIAHIFVDEK